MTTPVNIVSPAVAPPTTPGWYRYSGGRHVMVFFLDPHGQWWAYFDNGTAGKCHWGYIEQALSVWDLVLMVAYHA